MSTSLSNDPISTTSPERPYWVLLASALNRFQARKVLVRDHVVTGDRIIVRAASGDGYWYIPNDPELTRGGGVPTAVFEPDRDASFSCPAR